MAKKKKLNKQERRLAQDLRIKEALERKGVIKFMSSPYETKGIGPSVESVDKLSEPLVRYLFKNLMKKLDDEDAQGTYGELGWRNYFFGPTES